jgi:hypothetical protein
MPPDPFRTLPQKAMDAIAVFDHDPFTMEDFLNSVEQLHGITDFRDISSMLKHLIDSDAIRPLGTPGHIDAWVRGAPLGLD